MGYTHYFEQQRAFTNDEWSAVTADVRTLMQHTSVPVAYEDDSDYDPEISEDMIRFNGIGSDGHETFVLTRQHNPEFNFCKTAHKPYDELVCAVLAVVDYHARGVLDIGSDGDLEDWAPGLSLIRESLPPDRSAGVRLTFAL